MATTAVLQNEKAFRTRLAKLQASIYEFFTGVQKEARSTAIDIYDSIGDDVITNSALVLNGTQRNMMNSRLDSLVKDIIPILTQKDNWSKRQVEKEYNVAWYESQYDAATLMDERNYFVGNPNKRVRSNAFINNMDILSDSQQLSTRRRQDALRVRLAIQNGIKENKTLRQVTRDIDQVLGFRLADGSLTQAAQRKIVNGELVKRGGEIYQSSRIARTEMHAVSSAAKIDQMKRAQERGYDEMRLQKVSVLDTRTRPQSAQMDGQISNELGQFLYPDGNYYYMGQQPARWAINDRGSAAMFNPDAPDIDERTIRTPEGEVISGPYQTFQQYAQENDIKVNQFGQRFNF